MKKLAFILFAVLCVTVSVSAKNKPGKDNKPGKGSFGTEVQFNPFDQDGQTFSLDGLKFRYFLTDKDVIRLKLGFGMDHSSFKNESGDDQDFMESLYKYTIGDFKLDAGYERHFNVSKRISVYVGGSLGFTKHFASTKIEASTDGYSSTLKGEIKNGAITPAASDQELDFENLLPAVNDRAYWGFNAAVFTGLDFYVYKGLYVGTELGIGLKTQKSSDMTYSAVYDKTRYDEKSTDKISNVQLKTYIEPVLRLGWTF